MKARTRTAAALALLALAVAPAVALAKLPEGKEKVNTTITQENIRRNVFGTKTGKVTMVVLKGTQVCKRLPNGLVRTIKVGDCTIKFTLDDNGQTTSQAVLLHVTKTGK